VSTVAAFVWKDTRNLGQDDRCLSRDSNKALPEFCVLSFTALSNLFGVPCSLTLILLLTVRLIHRSCPRNISDCILHLQNRSLGEQHQKTRLCSLVVQIEFAARVEKKPLQTITFM
jgi:hypothetical protein